MNRKLIVTEDQNAAEKPAGTAGDDVELLELSPAVPKEPDNPLCYFAPLHHWST